MTVSAEFTPDRSHAGYEDKVHGGIISSLLDEALIWASYLSTDTFGVTAEMTIRFLKPLPIHTSCRIRGRTLKNRNRISFAESWIQDSSKTVYAKASGKVVHTQGIA